MAEFIRVADLGQLPPGGCTAVEVKGKSIALFNAGGEIFALDNECLHRGGPLGEGELDGDVITCPWHGWQYNIRTGERCGDPATCLARYEVKIEGDQILVAV